MFESSNRLPFPTTASHKRSQLFNPVVRRLVVFELAAPCHKLLCAKPHPKVFELNEAFLIGPPDHGNLYDSEKEKAPYGFSLAEIVHGSDALPSTADRPQVSASL